MDEWNTRSADGAVSVRAVDLDEDGDMDVLSVSNADDKIAWYENGGSGGFGSQQVITTSANGAWSVYAADGDMDVLSISRDDHKVAWYENDSDPGILPTECRASTSQCDVADYCDGGSAHCPIDQVNTSGEPCRRGSGLCDAEEICDGTSPLCPADLFLSQTKCRGSSDSCDPIEICDVRGPNCPADEKLPDGTTCTPGNGTPGSGSCSAGMCMTPTPRMRRPSNSCFRFLRSTCANFSTRVEWPRACALPVCD